MILQALVRHYEDLVARGLLGSPGWSQVNVAYALVLDEQGRLLRTVSLQESSERGGKTVLTPRTMELPAPVKRSSNPAANFLWDNAAYILGYDHKDNPQRAMKCFAASKALHEQLLADVDCDAARAVLGFFRQWQPANAANHPALQNELKDIAAGANLVFYFNGDFIQNDSAVRQAWKRHYDTDSGSVQGVCLVTGEKASLQAVHPAIKGVQGAQSSGAALVSFNERAFCSYGKEQNYNAPTGKYAAFAYTTALNYLLANRRQPQHIKDPTVVCWAEGSEPAYQDLFGAFAFEAKSSYSENELQGMVEQLLRGKTINFEAALLDPERPFYILGLAPNAARLSVRFFLRNSFGNFLANVQKHYERLAIVKPAYEQFANLSLGQLLRETVNLNTRDKTPDPNMAGEVLRSILLDKPYPATLLNGALLRIRAERKISWGRAAIIKAYYLKRTHSDIPKEVLTVSLNSESNNIPYTLGRLFSVLEAIQYKANPGINATIKDRYFNAAAAMPSQIFPLLINLSQKHLRKLEPGQRIYFEKQITDLLCNMQNENFPSRLNLPQQGAFQLGYYHQTQKRYEKKEALSNE